MAVRRSFGMVMLVVTMAIVLLLVAKRWQQLATSAKQTLPEDATHRPSTASNGSLGITGLREAEASTDAHKQAVGEALEAGQD